uniref:Uncharacterized protein n=1 Tax=Ditylum brightwellii TaxID=49249 RepID=A0A6V2HXK5_9STRA
MEPSSTTHVHSITSKIGILVIAILPLPPGLVISSISHWPDAALSPPRTMQMDHRMYYPPCPGSVEAYLPQHIPHNPSPGPPQEIVALCHPRRSRQPPSPQLRPHQTPSRGHQCHVRPVAPPPPVMHFIHQHPPATPTLSSSSQAQMDVSMSSLSSQDGFLSKDMARSVVKTEDNQQSRPQVPKREAMEQDIQADPVQSSSVVGKDTTVRFASDMDEHMDEDEHTDDNSSAESDTSEIEAKMDAALVLSALSFTKQGAASGGKGSAEAKGKKGLLLRKSRSPADSKRSSPGSMITWRARRAARAADNEYDN